MQFKIDFSPNPLNNVEPAKKTERIAFLASRHRWNALCGSKTTEKVSTYTRGQEEIVEI